MFLIFYGHGAIIGNISIHYAKVNMNLQQISLVVIPWHFLCDMQKRDKNLLLHSYHLFPSKADPAHYGQGSSLSDLEDESLRLVRTVPISQCTATLTGKGAGTVSWGRKLSF